MNVTVETHKMNMPPRTGERLEGRFRKVFARIARGVRHLHVSLKEDGTTDGKVCQMRIELQGGGQIIVRDRSPRMARAVGRCLRKARGTLTRRIKRNRVKQRMTTEALPAPA